MKVKEIYDFIDSFAPFSSQSPWDNSGLLIGSFAREVSGVILSLDVTKQEVALALETGSNLIISHHPVIFSPLKNIDGDSLIHDIVKHDINVICAHTNLDKAPGGVNDTLCEALGMRYYKCGEEIAEGCLNVGTIEGITSAADLANDISQKLHTEVRFTDPGIKIGKIAVCSGGGGEFFREAKAMSCNALITGEAKYHEFIDAEALGVAVFAAGHYETEVLITEKLKESLQKKFEGVSFTVSERKNPIFTVI